MNSDESPSTLYLTSPLIEWSHLSQHIIFEYTLPTNWSLTMLNNVIFHWSEFRWTPFDSIPYLTLNRMISSIPTHHFQMPTPFNFKSHYVKQCNFLLMLIQMNHLRLYLISPLMISSIPTRVFKYTFPTNLNRTMLNDIIFHRKNLGESTSTLSDLALNRRISSIRAHHFQMHTPFKFRSQSL